MVFNNREIAVLAWSAIALAWAVSRPSLRPPLRSLVRSIFKPVIIGTLLALAVWVAGCAWIGAQIGLWEGRLANETVWWFFSTGIILWFSLPPIAGEDQFFRRMLRRVITVGLLMEIFINLVVLPLWAELILLPFLALLISTTAFAKVKPEYAQAQKLLEWIDAVTGLGLFAYVVISLIGDPGRLEPAYLTRLIALPIWLTSSVLPLIYLLGLWIAYDSAFRMIGFYAEDPEKAKRSKVLLMRRIGLRPRRVGKFDGLWQRRLVRADNDLARQVVLENFLADQSTSAA